MPLEFTSLFLELPILLLRINLMLILPRQRESEIYTKAPSRGIISEVGSSFWGGSNTPFLKLHAIVTSRTPLTPKEVVTATSEEDLA